VLALPVLAEEALNMLVGFTNWSLAGRFVPGDEPRAAMGLLAYIMWLIPSLFSFVGIGATALVARFVGAGDRPQAVHATKQALQVGIVFAGVVMLVALLTGRAFIHAMGVEGLTADLAWQYLRIFLLAVPFVMFEQVATACLRGSGDTVSGLQARVLVNLTNVVVSAGLVTGWGPFPKLGWEGLAIGAVCGHIAGALMLLIILLTGRGGIRLSPQFERLDLALIRRLLRVGMPGGCDLLAVITCHLIYAGIINRLGTVAQAAHGLGVQIEAMSYLAGSAFQVAAATLVGQSLGAQNPARASRATYVASGLAMGLMCTAGTIFFIWGESFAELFAREPSTTTRVTGELLKIVALSCPFLAVLQVVSGALRGAGDTTFPLAITLSGLVFIRIPFAAILAWSVVDIPFVDLSFPGAGWGVHGAWIAMVADVAVRSALISIRFLRGHWRHVKV
jgi:putative MATE family efflux protein